MSATPVPRPRLRATGAIIGLLGSLLVAASATAQADSAQADSAQAAPEAARTVDVTTPVTSSSGRALTLGVTASLADDGAEVEVSLATRDGADEHAWRFRAGAADVAIDATGRGSVALTAARSGDRGTARLSFAPSGPRSTQRCGGETYAAERPVQVTGRVSFDSETSGWGRVGGAQGVRDFTGPAAVTWTYALDCPASSQPCRAGSSWSTYTDRGPTYTTVEGTRAGARSTLTATRYTPLGAPAGALRVDRVSPVDPRAPTFAYGQSSAQALVYGGTGRLRVTSADTPGTQSTACAGGGVQKQVSWAAEAANTADPFALSAEILGGFRIADGAQASIQRYLVQR